MHPVLVVVVFTLNRSFYPTTSAVPQCPSWFFILERYKLCGHRQWDREKPNVAKESRQANCTRYIRCTYLACIPVYHSGTNYSDYGVMRIIQVPFLVWFDTTEINNVTKVIYFSWYHVSRKCLRLYRGHESKIPLFSLDYRQISILDLFPKKEKVIFRLKKKSIAINRIAQVLTALWKFNGLPTTRFTEEKLITYNSLYRRKTDNYERPVVIAFFFCLQFSFALWIGEKLSLPA